MKKGVLALSIAAAVSSFGVQANQQAIDELRQQVAEQQKQIEALADALDGQSSAGGAWYNKVTVGGYGELHYNNLNAKEGDGDKEQIDLHRFVLLFGYQYTDNVRFVSEFEIEHTVAGDEKKGEVEVEQAFIEWRYLNNHSLQAGVFLVPVGILNETHEPDTFYGVERNDVEKNIIPTTWWEGGVGFSGEFAPGLNYDFAVTSGLKLEEGKYKIRDGRQKASEAAANDFAYTVAINYSGIPGMVIGASGQIQSDLWQEQGEDNLAATLFEAHIDAEFGPVGIRALYARWDIDSDIEDVKVGADLQTGFYVEPSYKITDSVGVFARFSEWDNQAGASSINTKTQQRDFGVNYWLTDTVVFKADYQNTSAPHGSKELEGVNLGVGYSF